MQIEKETDGTYFALNVIDDRSTATSRTSNTPKRIGIMNSKVADNKGVHGIHHVTAIARNPQRNLDFYTGVLGLRLVKRTVNFDDPATYHLYYGDYLGHPGTILTFFPWSDAPHGHRGAGQVTAVSFVIPRESLDYWMDRLRRNKIEFQGPVDRFGDDIISLDDPDGLAIELVRPSDKNTSQSEVDEFVWKEGPVGPKYAITGFHSATLSLEGYEHTAELLTGTLGFKLIAQNNKEGRFRFQIPSSNTISGNNNDSFSSRSIGSIVDVLCHPAIASGYVGIGTVHHMAWRAHDDLHQIELRKRILKDDGLNPTPVIDRMYFHSVYFREPGGILFEIATDPPGFAIDQKPEDLGKSLMLPDWLESVRGQLEKVLPPIKLTEYSRSNRKDRS
jgi:glyoxalase family protein